MSRHNKLMVGWVLLASFLLLCLMVPGYYTYNFVAFFVMMIYAAIMWQNNSRSTASGIDRRTPWILLGLMSFALLFGSTRSFPEPKYPEVPPVKSLAQVPVTIDGLSPGMTRSEILQLKGEPNLKDLNHVLLPLELGTQEVAETIEMLLAEYPDIPEKAEVLDWREELSISSGPVDERRQMMVETMKESLFEKEEPRILFTDHSLATQDYESLLKSVEMSDGGSTTYLFLAGDGYEQVAGLLLEDTVRRVWLYESENLMLVFNSRTPNDLELVSGQVLKLGGRPLARVGDTLDRLKPLGGSLEQDRHEFIKYTGPGEVPYRMQVFGETVFLRVKDNVIEGLQLGL